MAEVEGKSIPLAIGLNFVLPGAGYMYMGKIIVGIAALLLIIGIYFTTTIFTLFSTWIVMNVIMAIDMAILGKKINKEIEDKMMMQCPMCAEPIKMEAKICRHCGTNTKQPDFIEIQEDNIVKPTPKIKPSPPSSLSPTQATSCKSQPKIPKRGCVVNKAIALIIILLLIAIASISFNYIQFMHNKKNQFNEIRVSKTGNKYSFSIPTGNESYCIIRYTDGNSAISYAEVAHAETEERGKTVGSKYRIEISGWDVSIFVFDDWGYNYVGKIDGN